MRAIGPAKRAVSRDREPLIIDIKVSVRWLHGHKIKEPPVGRDLPTAQSIMEQESIENHRIVCDPF